MSYSKRFLTVFTVISTVLWAVGITLFVPKPIYAAVTTVGAYNISFMPTGTMYPVANSPDLPIFRFALNQSGDEALTGVTISVANNTSGVVADNTLADHINAVKVWRDTNGNTFFEQQTDTAIATQSVVNVATSTTSVTISTNNSIAATGALATSFFVTLSTDAGWVAPDAVKVSIAADGLTVTGGTHPAITAVGGASAVSLAAGGEGMWGGFSVANVSYVNATTVDIMFTDSLDLNTGAVTSTANYTLTTAAAGDNSTITSVMALPDNKSVRVTASGAQIVSSGADTIAVSANIKSAMGTANAATGATPVYGGMKPWVISEVKVGTADDQFDEFIELYNRSSAAVAVSANTLKLHLVNAEGNVDVNAPLTFLSTVTQVEPNKFLLIAPVTSPASSTADAVYSTSTIKSLVPNGAVYISNSTASSTAVIDKVCWGTHSVVADCEGSPAGGGLTANNGTSIERKAFGSSTSDTMKAGGTDAGQGNGLDTQNNNYDFVARAIPLAQNSSGSAEAPSGGFYGGDANQQPQIQMASVFRASASSTFNLVARMTDDGGPLPAANTLLIFCTDDTNTCAPVSSTPIYGVSIGSGWYKFTPTTTPWNNYKSYFRYYLQATDSANPAKSRVFTNDPNYDSTTYQPTWTGIQTQAHQIAKAFSVTVVQGSLGTASINGTIQNSSGAAVSDANVWIDGTQFAATTGSDGSFSFSNVGPTGGMQVRVAKEGYADQSISRYIPASGLISLGTICFRHTLLAVFLVI